MNAADPFAFSVLLERLKGVPREETRKQYDGYLEIVVQTEALSMVYPILEGYFGPPFKPAGIEPSQSALDITQRYGGIQRQQTLYFVQRDGLSSCAMIWPWSSGIRATIKLAQGTLGEKV